MATEPPHSESREDTVGLTPRPRWVKAFGIIAAVVVLLVVILLLAGAGGGHGPSRHTGGGEGETPSTVSEDA